MHFSTIASFAVVAYATFSAAAPISNNSTNTFIRLGCDDDSDCANRGVGWTCHHNICVAPGPAPAPAPAPAPSFRVGCETNADCANRGAGFICEHNICVAPPAPSSSIRALGCSTNADCEGRYPYAAVCVHAICVPAPSSSAAPSSSPPPALGCMSNYDCQQRYPGQNAYCQHNICIIPPISSAPVTSTKPTSSVPISSAPVSSPPPAYGCMTNKDCQDRYPGQNAYCGPHNICMFGQPSSSAKPSSSPAPPPPVGCMTDKDCDGRYPWPAVCQHNICVRKSITTSTTTTTLPPPPPPVGCMKDSDCNGRYPWEAVCKHNICVPKKPYVPTSTITVTPPPPPPPTTTTTGVTTITVYPPPPPYTPTTVTVYECTVAPTSSTTKTVCAEATLFPNLIVPIKQAQPNACYGTQYTGVVSSTTANNNIDSLLAFDVPFIYEAQNPTCQLTFTLPAIGSGFPRTVGGSGQVDLYALQSSNGIESATWNTRPARGQYLGRIQVVDGQIAGWIQQNGQVPCSGGSRVGVEMVPVGNSQLEWFEMKTPLTGLTLEIFA